MGNVGSDHIIKEPGSAAFKKISIADSWDDVQTGSGSRRVSAAHPIIIRWVEEVAGKLGGLSSHLASMPAPANCEGGPAACSMRRAFQVVAVVGAAVVWRARWAFPTQWSDAWLTWLPMRPIALTDVGSNIFAKAINRRLRPSQLEAAASWPWAAASSCRSC